MCVLILKTSHRPDGKMAHALALILDCATATVASINYRRYVPQRPAISHRPDGKIADVLASTLAYTTAADAPVNYRLMYVPQRLKISHRPDGKTADELAPPRWEDC